MRNRSLLFLALAAALAVLLAAPALADHDGDGNGSDSGTATVTADVGALAGARTITSVAGGAQGVSLPGAITAVLPTEDFTAGAVTLVQDPLDSSRMQAALAVVVAENLAPRINEWHVTLQSTNLVYNDGEDDHTIENSALSAGAPTVARLNALAGLTVNNGTAADLSDERLIYSVNGTANPLLLDVDLYASLQDITLDLPTSVTGGLYTGTFTVTLYE